MIERWLATLSLCLVPSLGWAACAAQQATAVKLNVVAGTILVSVAVNGIDGNFILDTGAARSLVTEAAVRRLGLARDVWIGTTMRGVGGIESRPNADPRSLTLGGVALARRSLSHDSSLTVGVLPRASADGITIDGLLGRDFLSAFDLDLDVPDRLVTLYRVSGCAGRFLPWQQGYTAMPVTVLFNQAIVAPVALDGVELRALLDTGASASLLGVTGMRRIGLEANALSGDPMDVVTGLGPRAVIMHRHRFRSLQVGGAVIADPSVWVAPIRLTPVVDMLLGADWLASRRVWISFSTRQVFVAAGLK